MGEGAVVVVAEEVEEDVLAGDIEIWIRGSNDHVGNGCLGREGQEFRRIEVGVGQRAGGSGLVAVMWKESSDASRSGIGGKKREQSETWDGY